MKVRKVILEEKIKNSSKPDPSKRAYIVNYENIHNVYDLTQLVELMSTKFTLLLTEDEANKYQRIIK